MTPREALELAARLPGPAAPRGVAAASSAPWPGSGSRTRPPIDRSGAAARRSSSGRASPPPSSADPEVLLLDEPLRALEADERTRLLRLPGKRRTVVLASRYPASEEGLASHVALIRGGPRRADGADRRPGGGRAVALACATSWRWPTARAGDEGGPRRQQAPAAAREPGEHRRPARDPRAVDDVPAPRSC